MALNNNELINEPIEIINGVKIEIPNFKQQLQHLNSTCAYDVFKIPKLLSIISEKQINEIQKFNNDIEDKDKEDKDKDAIAQFLIKKKDYESHLKNYENQVSQIITTRRNLFIQLKKQEWIIDYKIKKRQTLSLKYQSEISKLVIPVEIQYPNSEKVNYQIKREEPIDWVFFSYQEYKNQYKPSTLLTCKKLKDNFQYLHNIKLRVIEDRNELNLQLNTLLKLIQLKKKELNHLFNRLKKFENHKKQLFQKLVSLRTTRIKELLITPNSKSQINFQINSIINPQINTYPNSQNKIKQDLIEDLKNKTINYEKISILKYDTPIIINQVKEIKKFINARHIEKIKQIIMDTKKEMNDTYLKNFNNRLKNNFHISPHLVNKIRSTFPLIYKNKEAFQAFKNQILTNQIKTLNKIQNDNQDKITQLQSDLKNTKLKIQQCLQNSLQGDLDFKHTFQHYQKIIEKKEQHLLKAYRNYKKTLKKID